MSGQTVLNSPMAVAQNYTNLGNGLYNQALSLSDGSLTSIMGAATGLVGNLPPSQIRTLLQEVVVVAGDAAAGAAVGTALFPGFGTAIGAAIGAIIGVIQDIFSSNPPEPEQEFRPTADRYVFPGITLGTAAADPAVLFTPGWSDTPCRGHIAAYMYPGDGNKQNPFAFGVTWVSPFPTVAPTTNPMAPTSTAVTRAKARALAMQFMATDIITQLVSLPTSQADGWRDTTALHGQIGQIAATFNTTFGGDQAEMSRAMSLLESWYGVRNGFPTSSPMQALLAMYDANQGPPVDQHAGIQPFSNPQDAQFAAIVANASPFDYTYYAIPTHEGDDRTPTPSYDLATGTNIFFGIDTVLLGLAELACLTTATDAMALHYIIGLAWLWHQGQLFDHASDPLLLYTSHPNFSRILGIISTKTAAKASASAASSSSGLLLGTTLVTGAAVAGLAWKAHASGTTILQTIRRII